jgi:outer membrane protein assembly factor BamB
MHKPTVVAAIAAVALGFGSCNRSDPVFQGLASVYPSLCEWTQWGGSAFHLGQVCGPAQKPNRVLAELTFDPFVAQELAEWPELFAHYQVPLLAGDDAFVMVKAGRYVPCVPPGSFTPFPCGPDAWDAQIWTEKRLRWEHGQLEEKWTFASDWKPVSQRLTNSWESMFQPALSGDSLFVPGGGGTLFELDRESGAVLQRINPFGANVDLQAHVSGGITIDLQGTLFYNVLKLDPKDPVRTVRGFLVRIERAGGGGGDRDRDGGQKARPVTIKVVPYDGLNPAAPPPTDLCFGEYAPDQRPWPVLEPNGTPALPPRLQCGVQRPTANMTPAVGLDGTVFTYAKANFSARYSYVLALNNDLTFKWAASLRDVLDDGCGVLVPIDGSLDACRLGAPIGIEPSTGMRPAGYMSDKTSSTPVALPDGSVLIGAETTYNGDRGHTFKFDRDGRPAGTFGFGWDSTPAVHLHGMTYSIILKDNHYMTRGPFNIVQLDANMHVEWTYTNANTQTCTREPDGTVHCADHGDHPNGFEWCINAPAVDSNGTVHVTSEDGNFYSIGQGGVEKARVFLNLALGGAYTPLSIDPAGRIYAMNNGQLTVLGQ